MCQIEYDFKKRSSFPKWVQRKITFDKRMMLWFKDFIYQKHSAKILGENLREIPRDYLFQLYCSVVAKNYNFYVDNPVNDYTYHFCRSGPKICGEGNSHHFVDSDCIRWNSRRF